MPGTMKSCENCGGDNITPIESKQEGNTYHCGDCGGVTKPPQPEGESL